MKALSPVDQVFLWLEKRQQPMHVAGLQLYSFPEDAPDDYVSEIAAQMRDVRHIEPPFNQRLVNRFGQYFWDTDKLFDLEHHFQHIALPKPGRIRELLALVSAEHGHLLDRERPLWESHLIEGVSGRRFAIYNKAHHAMVDGISAIRMTMRALSTDPAARGRLPIWAIPQKSRPLSERIPVDAASSISHLLGTAGKQLSTIPAVTREFAKVVFNARKNPDYQALFAAPPSILNQKISGSRRFAAQSYSLPRIRKLGKALGATVNDVVLAICASALRDYLQSQHALPDAPLIAMVPMSLRQDDSTGGNQVGMILTSLATHLADPEARLRAIQSSIQISKQRYSAMTPEEIVNYTALTLAPAGLHLLTGLAPKLQTFNVVISNVPGPDKPLYWNGARLEGLYPVSIVLDHMALNMTLNSYCDQLEFGLIGCRRTLPSLQRLLDHLENGLAELEAACGIKAANG